MIPWIVLVRRKAEVVLRNRGTYDSISFLDFHTFTHCPLTVHTVLLSSGIIAFYLYDLQPSPKDQHPVRGYIKSLRVDTRIYSSAAQGSTCPDLSAPTSATSTSTLNSFEQE